MSVPASAPRDLGHRPPLRDLFPPAERTVPRMLVRQAERYGQRHLVAIGGVTLSYAETSAAAAGYAATFAAAGIKPGDRVAVMCGNRAEILFTILGCAWLGAIVVPINTASRGAQLEHILNNCGARLIVIEHDLSSVLTSLERSRVPLETVWLVGDSEEPNLPGFKCAAFPPPAAPMTPHPVEPGDTFAILYTSGTTGLSKGVCCPHAQYFWWGVYTSELLGIREGDVLMTTLPVFHTNALGTFFQTLLNGATLVVEPRFSASGFIPALARVEATVTFVLGAMVPMLLAQEPS